MIYYMYHVRYPGTYFKWLYKSVAVSALKNNVKCLNVRPSYSNLKKIKLMMRNRLIVGAF